MKTTLASILFASSAILAAANDHAGHGAMPSHHSTAAATKMVDGQVKKIDKAAGKVTLAHGPLANLGMDGTDDDGLSRQGRHLARPDEGRRQDPASWPTT